MTLKGLSSSSRLNSSSNSVPIASFSGRTSRIPPPLTFSLLEVLFLEDLGAPYKTGTVQESRSSVRRSAPSQIPSIFKGGRRRLRFSSMRVSQKMPARTTRTRKDSSSTLYSTTSLSSQAPASTPDLTQSGQHRSEISNEPPGQWNRLDGHRSQQPCPRRPPPPALHKRYFAPI